MRVEVMEHFGLTVPLNRAGYYETEHHKELMKDIRGAINEGRLIAVCGLIGSGKTVTLRRLQEILEEEKKITVSRSLAIDKHKVNLATLRAALFYDLSTEKNVRVPTGVERSERELLDLVRKNKRPVALFVDEAHDLNGHTLIGLKRLMELVEHGDGKLSVVLAGHPKLKNDLQRPTMEEIGFRTEIFSLDRITGSQREYILWLLDCCTQGRTKAASILTDEAIDQLATKLRTPLQVQRYLTLALEAAYQIGENPISANVVETVLSRQIDDLEPTLTRNGYRLKDLVEQFDAKPAELKALFGNTLDPTRTAELREKMLRAGLPI
jgi:type II secretory pathway predicted ATPase ExeA